MTIYEADDAAAIEGLYRNPAVIAAEERNHGTPVTPHGHDSVPANVPFLTLDLT